MSQILLSSEEYLKKRGIGRPRREAEDLIAHFLGMRRIDLYLNFDRPFQEEEMAPLRELIVRRGAKEPFAYIVGEVAFAGVQIGVNRAVLIPRPETEILVEQICTHLATQELEGKVLFDLCTGSGCIAIALKKRFPQLSVIASDLSGEALGVARKNCELNGVSVELLQGDLFAPFAEKECDYFVCNPPYIGAAEVELNDAELRFEPRQALVAQEEGLAFYRRIAGGLKKHLRMGGCGWLELGKGQGESVKNLFEKEGWERLRIDLDWSGHDRFFFLE